MVLVPRLAWEPASPRLRLASRHAIYDPRPADLDCRGGRIDKRGNPTNWHAIAGCAVGTLCGVFAGVFTDLGLLYLQYRPELPEWEFKARIGVMLGLPGGAFLGALFGGLWGWIVALRKPPAPPG